MEVNDQLIEKLAHLARLSFTDIEKDSIKTDLQRMISFIQKMDEVDTDHVEPLLHITEARNVLRKDEVTGTVTTLEAMKNAPVNDGHFFKVPKVIRK